MNIKSLCLVGTLFISVGVSATEPSKELPSADQNINSAVNNPYTSHVQVTNQQPAEQIQNSQATMNAGVPNWTDEQQNAIEELTNFIETYIALLPCAVDNEEQNAYYDNTEQVMYSMMNEEQCAQACDIYQGWNAYSTAWHYWEPWQYWCPNCAYSFHGTPER